VRTSLRCQLPGRDPDSSAQPARTSKARSTKVSRTLLISPCENGANVTRSMRPAKDSEAPGRAEMAAEPVIRIRRAVRWRSTAALMAVSRSGTRCTSSITTRAGSPARNPSGSAAAAARVAPSSSVRKASSVPSSTSILASVDLPTCRAPSRETTGVSAIARRIAAVACRGITAERRSKWVKIVHKVVDCRPKSG
jgi:hypothetical protein